MHTSNNTPHSETDRTTDLKPDQILLAAIVLDVEKIGLRDVHLNRDRLPISGNEGRNYLVVGKFERQFSKCGYVGLVDPVLFTLEDYLQLAPHLGDNLHGVFAQGWESARPRELLPSRMLVHRDAMTELHIFGDSFLEVSFRQGDRAEFLTEVFKNSSFIERMKQCSTLTVERERETLFNVWSHLDHYHGDKPVAFGPVYVGDPFSVSVAGKWEDLKARSQLISMRDLVEELGLPGYPELIALAKRDPDIKRRLDGALENEWQLLLENRGSFIPDQKKDSVLDLYGPPDKGYYEAVVTHSHHNLFDNESIQPSVDDLNYSITIRRLHAAFGALPVKPATILEHQISSVIVQPSNKSGSEFSGLIFKEVNGLPLRAEVNISGSDLLEKYDQRGVNETLEELNFAAANFKFSRGRLSPKPEKLIANLGAAESRISDRYNHGTPDEVWTRMESEFRSYRELEIRTLEDIFFENLGFRPSDLS